MTNSEVWFLFNSAALCLSGSTFVCTDLANLPRCSLLRPPRRRGGLNLVTYPLRLVAKPLPFLRWPAFHPPAKRAHKHTQKLPVNLAFPHALRDSVSFKWNIQVDLI